MSQASNGHSAGNGNGTTGVRQSFVDEFDEFEGLITSLMPLLKEYYYENGRPDDTPVVSFLKPSELAEALDVSLGHEGESADKIVGHIKSALKYSVRTSHPRFFDKLYAGSDPVGQVAELITALLNSNVHTYAVAPAFAVMEQEIIKSMATMIGFDRDTADGILCPGGTFANMSAMMVARNEKFPHVRMSGWKPEDRPVCFTSAQAHYSIKRGAMMAGFGMDNCVSIAANVQGCMLADALEQAIVAAKAEGKTPFFVSCTAGTTVMGGFDPFNEIRDICDKYDIWMHVDGAWGGSCIMSTTHRHLMAGAEKADSLTWNPHKALGIPVYASALITNNHIGALERSNNSAAEYLFHKHEASAYDLGDKSLQCGRRADALKLWLSWKRHGVAGFEKRVDKAFANAQYIAAEVKKRPGRFALVAEPLSCNVAFWFVPEDQRSAFAKGGHAACYDALDTVTGKVYNAMQNAGTMLVNFNPLSDHKLPRFFRIIMNQPRVTEADLDFVLDEIERLGALVAK
eukprot:m.41201 g.41201  ORF g.41201 m.41201 type:complete len:515 (+) comp6096_c0_seq2:61-1605(+)